MTSLRIREVWSWNFRAEFFAFLEALHIAGPSAFVAIDTEFPGTIVERSDYEALRSNVDLLKPIQLGVAVAARDGGSILGAWCFNLHFDVATDLHTDASIAFLSAGIDFARHAKEGLDATVLGQLIASTPFFAGATPACLVTFAGRSDLGYLLKLLTGNRLPAEAQAFNEMLDHFCPLRCDLRSWLPFGSLQSLVEDYGLTRCGSQHTAGSDALATLQLLLLTPAALAAENISKARVAVTATSEVAALAPSAPPAPPLPPATPASPVHQTAAIGPPPGLEPPPTFSRSPAETWASAARWASHSSLQPRRIPLVQGDADAGAGVARHTAASPGLWAAAAREAGLQLQLREAGLQPGIALPRRVAVS